MIGTKFIRFGTIAKVINYDDTSGKYIYKLLINRTVGYIDKEYVLQNKISKSSK